MTITSAPTPDASERHLLAYERQRAQGRMQAARRELLEALAGASELEWLACARALVLRSDTEAAHAVLSAALVAHPGSADLRFALAGILQQRGESAAAGEESWILNATDRTAHPRRVRAPGCFAHADARSSARRVTVRTKSSLNSASA